VEAAVAREQKEIERREQLYRGDRPAADVRGKAVLLVDDGLATGSTMVAAARCVGGLEPEQVIVAVPVASREACARMREEADLCVCLFTPQPFDAVGRWYLDFRQVSDAEVRALLAEGRQSRA
ncbi:MAG: phosphoribosyltransferase, partial [Bryobacteraceae bacterium]